MARAGGKTGPAARVVLLSGPEAHEKETALRQLLDELVPDEDRDFMEVLDASEASFTAARLLDAARDVGMFTPRRVIVVRHADALRERRHDRNRELLAEGLGSLPETAAVVFVTGAEEEGGPRGAGGPLGEGLTAVVRKLGEARNFLLLKPEEVARRVREHAAGEGKQISPAVAAQVARRAGPALHRALSETEKLVRHAGERGEITPEDVEALLPAPVEESVFTLLTQAALGNRRQAMESLRRLLESGEHPGRIMPLLARTLRQVLQAKYLRENRVRPGAAREQLPAAVAERLPAEGDLYATAPQPWQRERAWEQAGRFSWEQLRAAVNGLALAEAGTKGWEEGPQELEVALELFVVRLCDRSY